MDHRLTTDKVTVKAGTHDQATLQYPPKQDSSPAASIDRLLLERALLAAVARDTKIKKSMVKLLGEERLQKQMEPPPVFAEELRSDSVGELWVRLADSTLIAIFKERRSSSQMDRLDRPHSPTQLFRSVWKMH